MSLWGSALAACDGGGVILHLTAAGVDLNNECHWTTDGGGLSRVEGPSASGPAVRVYLVLLLVFLRSLDWANTLSHYLTQAFSLNFHENSDKTKHLQLAVVVQNLLRGFWTNTWQGCSNPWKRPHLTECVRKSNSAWRGRSEIIIAKIYCSKTLSRSCLDCKAVERKVSTLRAEYTVEWVIEKESVGKLGTVTDLASVSLRSISAGLKLNTASCSALLRIYSYSKTLSSQAQMLMTSNCAKDACFM